MSGDAAESRATFDAVVDGVAAWQPDETATRGLCEYLDRRLNEGVENIWEREVVEREPGSSGAEVVVNGEIAVVFAEAVGPTTVSELRQSLSALARRYSYLVVYWRDPERADRGYRWSVERSISARRVGTRGLTFVTPPDESSSGEGLSSAVVVDSCRGGDAPLCRLGVAVARRSNDGIRPGSRGGCRGTVRLDAAGRSVRRALTAYSSGSCAAR